MENREQENQRSALPPKSRAVFERHLRGLIGATSLSMFLWHIILSLGLMFGGFILLFVVVLTILGFVVSIFQSGEHFWWGVAMVIMLVASLIVIAKWIVKGERHQSRLSSFSIPTEKIVLYLRPFSRDQKELNVVFFAPQLSLEQELVNILSQFGPFWAVGKPGEELPRLGARRMYIENQHWENSVKDLMSEATIVVLMPGLSASICKELGWMLTIVDPTRIIVLFDSFKFGDTVPCEDDQWDAFFKGVQDTNLPNQDQLPQKLGDNRYLRFRPDWTPILLGAQHNIVGTKEEDDLHHDLMLHPPGGHDCLHRNA